LRSLLCVTVGSHVVHNRSQLQSTRTNRVLECGVLKLQSCFSLNESDQVNTSACANSVTLRWRPAPNKANPKGDRRLRNILHETLGTGIKIMSGRWNCITVSSSTSSNNTVSSSTGSNSSGVGESLSVQSLFISNCAEPEV